MSALKEKLLKVVNNEELSIKYKINKMEEIIENYLQDSYGIELENNLETIIFFFFNYEIEEEKRYILDYILNFLDISGLHIDELDYERENIRGYFKIITGKEIKENYKMIMEEPDKDFLYYFLELNYYIRKMFLFAKSYFYNIKIKFEKNYTNVILLANERIINEDNEDDYWYYIGKNIFYKIINILDKEEIKIIYNIFIDKLLEDKDFLNNFIECLRGRL